MFVRSKKSKSKGSTAVQVVEAYRFEGKPKQRVIRHVGTAKNPEEIESLKHIARAIIEELSGKTVTQDPASALPSLEHIVEISRKVVGIHDVYGKVYDLLGFTNPFKNPARREASAKLLRDIVLARVTDPCSKRATVRLLQEHFQISRNIDHVYQMMDKIDDDFCDRIQRSTLQAVRKLTGTKLRVLFYDATTLYFESFTEDDLKQNGFSKDMKFGQPQVLLTLFVTERGLPIGYEVFPVATFEGHTLEASLKRLKARYHCQEIVLVADSGLLSRANIDFLEGAGYKFIVGARLKSLKKLQSNKVKQWGSQIRQTAEATQEYHYELEGEQGRRLVLSYRVDRAKKDKHDREKSIAKLKQKLEKSRNPKSLLSQRGIHKLIEIKGDSELLLREDKLEEEAAWDGITGVWTNKKDLSLEEIWSHYRGLWQVEESFRINKHDLKMRPIYHWKPHRVKAHLAICFMAFACVRYLEYRISKQYKKLSPEEIRKALQGVQASELEDKQSGVRYLLPSAIPKEAVHIYTAMGLKKRLKSKICNA